MSQPFDRMCMVPAPKKPDERLKDWWVESPWLIVAKGKSLSGYERNRVFLSRSGQAFYEISGLTTADSDGDGRSVVACDLTGDGMEDLLVRQAGGGPLLFFENRFPKANWLRVSLRSPDGNRWGVGARLVAEAGGQKIVRELFPYNGFKAQGPAHAHFGLNRATRVERLTITWPSGKTQVFTEIPANRSIRLTEGSSEIVTRAPL